MKEAKREWIFDEQINFVIDEKTKHKHNNTVIITIIIEALVDVVSVRVCNGTHRVYGGDTIKCNSMQYRTKKNKKVYRSRKFTRNFCRMVQKGDNQYGIHKINSFHFQNTHIFQTWFIPQLFLEYLSIIKLQFPFEWSLNSIKLKWGY